MRVTSFNPILLFALSLLPIKGIAQATLANANVQTHRSPTLLQGTPVMLLLDQTLDGEHARIGQRVAFEVSGNVELNGRVLIPSGASALGTVTQSSRNRFPGHGMRVSVNLDAVRLPGGQVVPLSISPDPEDAGRGTRDDAIAVSLVPPAGRPHFLSPRHRDAVIPQGTEVRAFVRRDTVLVEQTASVGN